MEQVRRRELNMNVLTFYTTVNVFVLLHASPLKYQVTCDYSYRVIKYSQCLITIVITHYAAFYKN